MRYLKMFLILLLLLPGVVWAGLEMGQVPSTVELKDELGGRLDGSLWSSREMQGKVHVLFYADPDEKDLNNEASEALSAAKFSRDKYQSIAIINMAATWLPNFAISSSLKEKQKAYPNTLYLRDFKKVLVEKWGIADDNNDVLVFDQQGRLIFRKDGQLNGDEIKTLLQLIQEHIDRP